MRFFLPFIFTTFLFIGVADAGADNSKIAVVDLQAIMSESKAGKNIIDQLKSQREKYQKEISEREDGLKEREKGLVEKRSSLNAEDFQKERQSFEKQVFETQKMIRDKRVKLDKAVGVARDTLRDKAVQIIGTMAEEKGASLVLPRQNLIVIDDTLDLTEQVITALDKEITKITVKF